jgi:hypothetical protein
MSGIIASLVRRHATHESALPPYIHEVTKPWPVGSPFPAPAGLRGGLASALESPFELASLVQFVAAVFCRLSPRQPPPAVLLSLPLSSPSSSLRLVFCRIKSGRELVGERTWHANWPTCRLPPALGRARLCVCIKAYNRSAAAAALVLSFCMRVFVNLSCDRVTCE